MATDFPVYGKLLAQTMLLLLCACNGSGTSSTSAPPASPTNIVATAGDGHITLNWEPVTGSTSYNLYWSNDSGVSKTSGNRISAVMPPLKHTGLVNSTQYFYIVTAVNNSGESAASAQVSATATDGGGTFDTYYPDQWHLSNSGQNGGMPGEDANLPAAWGMGFRGEGIRIAVVDEDLEITHEDLETNIAIGLSHNYLDGLTDPQCPGIAVTCGHGTAVAGLLAARDLNDTGVRGSAPRANIVGYNLLQARNISNEADAMIRDVANVHISINSWGAPDNADLHAAPMLWRDAILIGLTQGRGGRGTVYVWAAGNGALADDNSNYDGYANNRGVIAVCAVDDQGVHADYSEPGANLRVCAPSRAMINAGHGISTTDRTGATGKNINGSGNYANTNYTRTFTGTSAAAPITAGIVALMLQARPDLGWRDVQLILAQSARRNDPGHADWSQNGAGQWINHDYGFGVVDANAAITTALSWTSLGPELTYMQSSSPQQPIPDNDATGVDDTMTISGSVISEIEYIEIMFSANDHSFSGDLEITLTNETTGTQSRLSGKHNCPGLVCTAYDNWIFGSARHVGEAVDGQWTLSVADLAAADLGTFQSWSIKFYGH